MFSLLNKLYFAGFAQKKIIFTIDWINIQASEKPMKHKLVMGKLGTAAFIMFCSQNLWPDDQISRAKHIGNVLTLLCSFFLVVLLESFLWIGMCSIWAKICFLNKVAFLTQSLQKLHSCKEIVKANNWDTTLLIL